MTPALKSLGKLALLCWGTYLSLLLGFWLSHINDWKAAPLWAYPLLLVMGPLIWLFGPVISGRDDITNLQTDVGIVLVSVVGIIVGARGWSKPRRRLLGRFAVVFWFTYGAVYLLFLPLARFVPLDR